MKKAIALFGSLLVLVSTRSKAQNTQPPTVKKETVKPANGTPPKADAIDQFLKVGTVKGEKLENPVPSKAVNANFTKGAGPAPGGAQSPTNQQVALRHTPPPTGSPVAPRHNESTH